MSTVTLSNDSQHKTRGWVKRKNEDDKEGGRGRERLKVTRGVIGSKAREDQDERHRKVGDNEK